MFKINIPDIKLRELFKGCVQTYTRDLDKKSFLSKNICKIQHEQNIYHRMAQSGELYQIAERRFDNDNIEYFAWVYTNRLAKKTVNGRKYYDIILLSSSSICPYCGQELASTLDHYLPKEKFPEFSISPCNLVPCCPNCNSKKSS